MEKYRAKQQRSWNEVASRLRQVSGNKRPFLEDQERDQLLKCLGLLQKSIKIKSAQNMIERLDNITRQLGLKLTKDRKRVTESQPVEFEVFISSDMFYVEVMIEASGRVRDVKIAHHGDPIRCPELCSVLQASDFAAFGAHLEGLIAIYRLNCDKSVKQKAYVALQNLEKKLVSMANLQSEITDVNDLIFKSPVGILVPRRGGFPMQLTYFVSPYDFVTETGERLPCVLESITRYKLGQRVSISIENSEQPRVPSASEAPDVLLASHPSVASKPQSFPINGAFYTMKLSIPLAVDVECLVKIKAITGLDVTTGESQPLVKLITQRDVAKAFHVKLPDQNHTYFIAEGDRMGVMVESIQFTSSKQIPPVLDLLRHQCFFNCLILSCVREFEPETDDDCQVFEVNPNGLNAVCVSFEHPLDCESLLTIELRFENILYPNCQSLFKNDKTKSFISDAHVATALQMSFSIPVVMRSILNKASSLKKTTETLKNQSSDSSIISFEAAPGAPQDPFYDFEGSSDNMAADSMRQKLFDLENFCQQEISSFSQSSNNQMCPAPDLDPTQQQMNAQQQIHQQSITGPALKAPSNQQESFDLIDDSMFFDATYPAARDTSNEVVQSNCLDRTNHPDQFNELGSESPSASGDRFRYQHSEGQQVDARVPPTGRPFDSNQKNLLTGGDSSESPPLNRPMIPTSTAGGATITAMPMKTIDERKESKPSSKSKKSSSNHGKKKERSSSKDRSSTKSSGSSSKSSSSKSSSSKDKKRTSDGSSSRSSLVAGFDRSHQSLKKDSPSPSKHSSTSEKQFTVRQSSSAQGMKLTINKARAPDGESRSSSSSSSSKHHRSSSRSKNQSSVSSNHSMKQSSSTGKLSPKDGALPLGLPIVVDDENDAIDLVEKRLRVIHGEGAAMNHFVAARASTSSPTVGNKLFEDAFMD